MAIQSWCCTGRRYLIVVDMGHTHKVWRISNKVHDKVAVAIVLDSADTNISSLADVVLTSAHVECPLERKMGATCLDHPAPVVADVEIFEGM